MSKKNGSRKKRQRADWKGYVNVYLSDDEKKRIKDEDAGLDELMLWAAGMVSLGYRFTLSWDDYSDCFKAQMSGDFVDLGDNAGKAISFRHVEPEIAIAALRYAIDELFGRGDWKDEKDVNFAW
jgi:hypothetical protein